MSPAQPRPSKSAFFTLYQFREATSTNTNVCKSRWFSGVAEKVGQSRWTSTETDFAGTQQIILLFHTETFQRSFFAHNLKWPTRLATPHIIPKEISKHSWHLLLTGDLLNLTNTDSTICSAPIPHQTSYWTLHSAAQWSWCAPSQSSWSRLLRPPLH